MRQSKELYYNVDRWNLAKSAWLPKWFRWSNSMYPEINVWCCSWFRCVMLLRSSFIPLGEQGLLTIIAIEACTNSALRTRTGSVDTADTADRRRNTGLAYRRALSYTIMCLSGTPIGAVDPGSGEGGSSRADHSFLNLSLPSFFSVLQDARRAPADHAYMHSTLNFKNFRYRVSMVTIFKDHSG